MATFYLLPPRPQVGACFAYLLQELLPGQNWTSQEWTELADSVTANLPVQPDTFLVFGEELTAGEDQAQVLRDVFGAEPGDEIIEVHTSNPQEEGRVKRWRLEAA